MKRNEGFTLIELIVTILVATIVAASASAVLLMGMRMHKASTEQAGQQINASFVMTALEDIASEAEIKSVTGDSGSWWVEGGQGPLFHYDASTQGIYIGAASESPLLEGVTASSASLSEDKTVLTISVTVDGKEYKASVYCRLNEKPTESSETKSESDSTGTTGNTDVNTNSHAPNSASSTASFSARSVPNDFLSTNWLAVSFSQQRQNFLSVLEGELGSGGMASTGEYFSEWYIGSYEENPGWDENTPWCACFISWALEQCAQDLMEVPRFAHVDDFLNDFSLGFWRTKDPSPGDIIFFDWTVDAVQTPEHVGVVTAVENGIVHTIEGNADGRVAKRAYEAGDPCILGYGVLKWK